MTAKLQRAVDDAKNLGVGTFPQLVCDRCGFRHTFSYRVDIDGDAVDFCMMCIKRLLLEHVGQMRREVDFKVERLDDS